MFHCFPVSGHRLRLLYIMISIPICSEQTGNELKLKPLNPTQHWLPWRPWKCLTPAQESQEVNLPRDLAPRRLSWLSLLGDPSARDPRNLTCLRIWSLEGCHTSTRSGIHQSRDPRKLTSLDLPRDSISRRLSCLSLPGDLHPDPETPGSQVAIVLGRIHFRKTHP